MSAFLKPFSAAAIAAALLVALMVVSISGQQPETPPQDPGSFRFNSGVDLVNVTATVSDASGRFVPNLRQEDFTVYEDDKPVEVSHFSSERVPVSLGIALDTSGSMVGEKMDAARNALNRFLTLLLNRDDEMFLYRFSNRATLVQRWSNDRQAFTDALGYLRPNGGTSMYDAIVEAVPLVGTGRNQKKALLIISDGRDTSSSASVMEAKGVIRESEALVYAVGIDCSGGGGGIRRRSMISPQRRGPFPVPFPVPGGRQPWPQPPQQPPDRGGFNTPCSDPVDVEALRDMTDDSGGRTEIVRETRDLEPATSGIADELTKQYYLGYAAPNKKDGRWHTIRVEVNNRNYRVRARRGYLAN